MKSRLPPLVAPFLVFGALVSLAACDQPKPRPAEPTQTAPAAAPIAAASKPVSAGLAKRDGMAGFSLDGINEAQDPLNKPATVAVGGPVTFTGFGFDPVAKAPAAAVDIVIDGVAYPAVYGHRRADVATYFKVPALENTGFSVTLPAGVLKPGRHEAIVRVVSADKAGYFDSAVIAFDGK